MQTERSKNRPVGWKVLSDTSEKPGDCGITQAKWREFLKDDINNWKQQNASGNLISIIFAKIMEIRNFIKWKPEKKKKKRKLMSPLFLCK